MAVIQGNAPPLRVAVDLTSLRPGGENGGIKPFLFETLLWLGRQRRVPLRFLYLTDARTHAEVRDTLARVEDELVCVRGDDDALLPCGDERAPRERAAVPPPADLLWRLGAQVLYCPFGSVEFAVPGVRTISTVVDVLHRDFPWSLSPEDNAARERAFQDLVATADALQCNSDHVMARLREHYGVPPERLFKVYNAVHERFSLLPLEWAATAALPATPFFFYPANAWKHKNHETLLLAYSLYRARTAADGTAPWRLVLTGHEDARWVELRALARTLGLAGDGAAEFVGYVPAEAFGRWWGAAGALVFPSLHEGFGIPLLEAMHHGVPILCSRAGSLPEVGGDACLFVDARRPEALADGMHHLATEPALRQRLVAAGRQRLTDFSQDREAGGLLAVIAALAGAASSYRPLVRGIHPDGWTERSAVLALPRLGAGEPGTGRLTLRFHRMPAPRRLRLRRGAFGALGSFDLPPGRAEPRVCVDLCLDGDPMWLEVPDAANLHAADPRVHGVRLLAADLRTADGRDYPLFAAR